MADTEVSGRTLSEALYPTVAPYKPSISNAPDIPGALSIPETDPAAHVETLRMATREEVESAILKTNVDSVAYVFLRVFETSSKIKRGEARREYEVAQTHHGFKAPFAIAFSNARKSSTFREFEVNEKYASKNFIDDDQWTLFSNNVVMQAGDQVPEDITKVHSTAAEIGQATEDNKVKIVLLSLFHQYLGVDIAKLAKAIQCKPEEVIALIGEINTKHLNAHEAEIHLRNNIAILQPKRQWTLTMDNQESRERFLEQDQQIAYILGTIQAAVEAAKAKTTPAPAAAKPTSPDAEPPKTFEDKIRNHVDDFETLLDYKIALAIAYDSDNDGIGLSITEITDYVGKEEAEESLIQGRMEEIKLVLKSIAINLIKIIKDGKGVYLLKPGSTELPQAIPLSRHQAPRPPQPPRPIKPATPPEKPKSELQDTVTQNRPAFKGNNPLFEIAKQLARESDKKEPGSTIEELALKHGSTYRRVADLLTPLKEVLASIGLELLRKDTKGKPEFSIGKSPSQPPSLGATQSPRPQTQQQAQQPKPPTPSTPLPRPERATLDLSKLEGKTFKDTTEANQAIMGALTPVIISGQQITTGVISALRRELEMTKSLHSSGMETRLQRYIDKLRRAEQNAKNGVIRDHHLTEIYGGVQ